ncbi:MAG: hypothetical protein V8T48_09260 [Oscillospiraceae bacterium]
MVANKKITGRATSLPAGLAIGAVCSLAATLILTAILAKLVEAETLPVEKVGYGIMVLLIVSSFAGRYDFLRSNQTAADAGVHRVWGDILRHADVHDRTVLRGQYSAVGTTALLVLAGSGAAALLGLRQGRGAKRTKIKVPHR